jgi:hypothetical protein
VHELGHLAQADEADPERAHAATPSTKRRLRAAS